MIKFEKISYKQFKEDWKKCFGRLQETKLKKIYESIQLPRRATEGSAGYDFFAPMGLTVDTEDYVTIPTCVRFVVEDEKERIALLIVPRSGLGFKYGERLANTAGVIDADYCRSDNEGHIMVRLKGETSFVLKEGDAFCQGIIVPYYITDNDAEYPKKVRNGGFGSTSAAKQ